MKTFFFTFLLVFSIGIFAQNNDVPVQINMENGESFNVAHFGKIKCGKESFSDTYTLIRGNYMGTLTEIKEYKDIEKIVFFGYSAEPAPSVGNEKGKVIIYKKNGVSVELSEAEVAMSCYNVGDEYNSLTFKVLNPLTGKALEKTVATKDIKSVVFR